MIPLYKLHGVIWKVIRLLRDGVECVDIRRMLLTRRVLKVNVRCLYTLIILICRCMVRVILL